MASSGSIFQQTSLSLNALMHSTFSMNNAKENDYFIEMDSSSIPPSLSTSSATGLYSEFPDESVLVGSMESVVNNLSQSENKTSLPDLPIDMQFNEGHRLAVTIYSLLMIVSAIGNLSVLSAIVKLRIKGRLTRINMFLLHLVIADLLVTFLMMPLEIIWNATVSWHGGDALCRIMSFFRIFGLYLSGFILVCISLDRYFAVLKPLAIPEANSRGKIMLILAWVASVICSLPQSFIFHVERHPQFEWYEQCVTFHSFPSQEYELAYNFFGFVFLYAVPLIMIVFCYSRILYEIYRINALKRNEDELRRSNMGALGRAKIRTLKMTILIIGFYIICWTPYQVMCLWYWFDKKSAQEVDQRIQKGLFLFACTNSCVNPLIYGLFHFRPRQNSSITVPRSLPNGYHRPPAPSENANYKMRVRWRPNECCIMGCGSSGNNNDTTQIGSTTRDHHVYRRPTQQYWIGPTRKYSNANSEQPTRRDITIATSAGNGHDHHYRKGNGRRSVTQCHNGHRRCSNFQMTELGRHHASQTSAENNIYGPRHNYIDDKNNKRSYISSLL